MIKKFTTYVLLLAFSWNTMGAPIEKAHNLNKIMTKYDYLLSSHPQAHEKNFRASTIEKFQAELGNAVSTASKAELNDSFNTILEQIPTQDKREAYLKVLQNSSKSDISRFLTDPTLLADSLRGESANFFTGSTGLDILIIAIAALLVYALIAAIVNVVKYQTFYASFYLTAPSCTSYSVENYNSPSDVDENIETARARCESRANNPNTCQYSGWSFTERSDSLGFTRCDVKATFQAER